MTEATLDRALEVQGRLAERSQHRGVSLPDLIVAACAESAGLTVMHYDADYERVAEVTWPEPVRWVVPRGQPWPSNWSYSKTNRTKYAYT